MYLIYVNYFFVQIATLENLVMIDFKYCINAMSTD